ncbi:MULTISPECIES: hypothetical protein [Burkholderia]|uniref:hypothetical protein n=1 Tax=Burkholderia TaxID=32008 RepID=UPI0011CE3872|nr:MULTISPECIES: hypothetical protein [Burkholderia]
MSLFATTSRRSQPAAYLKLFLETLADERLARSLSAELRLYVFQAAQHAAHFVSNPAQRVPRGWPEAVDLAFEIRDNDQLVHEILELKTENDIAPELAQRLLREFKHDPVGDRAAVAL